MKIYTKTGDTGQSSLFGGKRVSKDNLRLEAYGTIDELNSSIGLIRSSSNNQSIDSSLDRIQQNLFHLGSHLACEEKNDHIPSFKDKYISELETQIDKISEELTELRNFILPGGTQSACFCHQARTVCRRAERRVVSLHRQTHNCEVFIQYLNRLSDYLFVLARYLNHKEGIQDILWVTD